MLVLAFLIWVSSLTPVDPEEEMHLYRNKAHAHELFERYLEERATGQRQQK